MAREARELVTIPDAVPVVEYAESAVPTTEFAFNFPYWKEEDIQVWTRPAGTTEWVETFAFAVTPTGGFAQTGYEGATITLPSLVNTGVTIARRGTFDRLSNLNPGQALDIFSLNRDLNRSVGLHQTLRMLMNASIQSTDPTDYLGNSALHLPNAVVRADGVLGFDGDGVVEIRSVNGADARSLALNSEVEGLRDLVTFSPDLVLDISPTIAAMKAMPVPLDGATTRVADRDTGGFFVFRADLVAAGNEVTTFTPDDGTPGSWQRQFSGPINVKWSGAKGDGATDDTLAVQRAIDAAIAQGTAWVEGAWAAGAWTPGLWTDDPYWISLLFPYGTYLVRKNTALAGFPDDDQPCLLVQGARAIRFIGDGATLRCNTHAQGVLEIIQSRRLDFEGLRFRGAENFPQQDGTTGSSEKSGVGAGGYQTTGFWGYYKNNSFDSSLDDRGGFGGAFPQWGGGTAATWGTWNGGFIGNIGSGVLVRDDCEDISFRRCDSRGFNRAGFCVGHLGDFWPVNKALPDSRNIRFIECVAKENYSHGIELSAVDGYAVINCDASVNGHPDADATVDDKADPGYGIGGRATQWSQAKNGIITGNKTLGNKRKGVDVHAGKDLVICNNITRDNPVAGIYVEWQMAPAAESSGLLMNANILDGNGFGPASLSQMYIGGNEPAAKNVQAVASNNIFKRSAVGGIRCRYGSNVSITGNVFRGSMAGRDTPGAFIDVFPNAGLGGVDNNVLVANNNIDDTDGHVHYGIRFIDDFDMALANSNNIRMMAATAVAGMVLVNCTGVHATGNVAKLGAAGTPLALSQTDGHVFGNYGIGGSAASSTIPITRGNARPPDAIGFTLTFATGLDPVISNNTAPNIVTSCVSTAFGLQVLFSNLVAYIATNQMKATWSIRSSGGINYGGFQLPFMYVRTLNSSSFELGMKSSPTGSNAPANTVIDGTLDILITMT